MDGNAFGMVGAIWPFILMAAIFYFMLWRPQKKDQQKRQRMLDSLKKGDKVVTIGGMMGVLTNVGQDKITLEVSEGVEIEFVRSAISGFQDPAKQERAEKGEN